jgi:hypothetical protein
MASVRISKLVSNFKEVNENLIILLDGEKLSKILENQQPIHRKYLKCLDLHKNNIYLVMLSI